MYTISFDSVCCYSAVQKQTTAIQQFDFCNSKIFVSHLTLKIFLSRSTLSVHKFSAAVQLFNLTHSKIFLIRSTVRAPPFKNFPHSFSHLTSSVQKFSSAVQPFDFIHSQIFLSRSAVQCIRFERFVDPFLIRSLAVRSAVRTDTLRNVFA